MEAPTAFTAAERNYIRLQLDMFFSTLPSVADGFQLKTWCGGPLAGQPKLPPAAKSRVERGLMRLDESSPRMPRLFFTEPELGELRAMMADRRYANPAKFAHVSQALGRTAEPCRLSHTGSMHGVARGNVDLGDDPDRLPTQGPTDGDCCKSPVMATDD